jgi:hypothetical protein
MLILMSQWLNCLFFAFIVFLRRTSVHYGGKTIPIYKNLWIEFAILFRVLKYVDLITIRLKPLLEGKSIFMAAGQSVLDRVFIFTLCTAPLPTLVLAVNNNYSTLSSKNRYASWILEILGMRIWVISLTIWECEYHPKLIMIWVPIFL